MARNDTAEPDAPRQEPARPGVLSFALRIALPANLLFIAGALVLGGLIAAGREDTSYFWWGVVFASGAVVNVFAWGLGRRDACRGVTIGACLVLVGFLVAGGHWWAYEMRNFGWLWPPYPVWVLVPLALVNALGLVQMHRVWLRAICRRYLRLRLLTVTITVGAVTAAAMGLAVFMIGQARRVSLQSPAVGRLERLGGRVYWQDGWVVEVNLGETAAGDEDLADLSQFPMLSRLYVDGTEITDAGLVYVHRLRELESLSLSKTAVTDEGLRRIGELPKLEGLWLDGTGVTDSGIAHLKSARRLSELILSGTSVTNRGVEHLIRLRGLKRVSQDDTDVSREGFRKLAREAPCLEVER